MGLISSTLSNPLTSADQLIHDSFAGAEKGFDDLLTGHPIQAAEDTADGPLNFVKEQESQNPGPLYSLFHDVTNLPQTLAYGSTT
jgi:hypothetical protein